MGQGNAAITVVTLNAGFPLFGRRRGWFPGHVQRLVTALLALQVDLLLLQEAFGRRRQALLRRGLHHDLAHACCPGGPGWGVHHGLMILARYPLRQCRFTPFRGISGGGRVGLKRGVLSAVLYSPNAPPLSVLNVHLTPGVVRCGLRGFFTAQDSPRSQALRSAEITQTLQHLRAGQQTLLGGDFNCGPEISSSNYRQLLHAGLSDAGANPVTQATWSSGNPLNRRGPFARSPSQRIDHIFFPEGTFRVLDARLVLDERYTAERGRESYPLSDHYGLRTQLALGCFYAP